MTAKIDVLALHTRNLFYLITELFQSLMNQFNFAYMVAAFKIHFQLVLLKSGVC